MTLHAKKEPKLRFREYSSDWQEINLGNIFTFKNGFNADKSKYGKGIKYISVSDIINNRYITYDNIIGSVDASDKEIDKNLVEFGDVLFQRSSETREEVGQSNIYIGLENAIFGGFVIRGKPIAKYDPHFMNYVLRTQSVRKDITNRSGGSTRYNIGQESLSAVTIITPSIQEQNKIAMFLNSVDDLIEGSQKKLKLLKSYKKDAIRTIFSRRYVFKDISGNPYPAWTEKKLATVLLKCSVKNKGSTHKLVQSVSNTRGFINQTELFKDHVIASKDLSNYYIIEQGMFAYNPSRIDVGSLAYKFDNQTSVVSPLYVCFRADNSAILDEYLLSWFETTDFKKQMKNSFEGSVRNTLSYDSLGRMVMALPLIEEQQKISNFLSALNDKLRLEETKLDQANKFKKALLQGMFV